MKNFILSLFAAGLIFTTAGTVKAQVSINNDGSSPHASAMLEVKSTSRGFLPPRMTTAQRVALGGIATAGLVVYDTDLKKLYFHNGITWDEGGVGNYWLKSGSFIYNNALTDFVGIGVNNPARSLEVRGSSWQTARISSPSTGAGLEFVSAATTDWSVNSFGTYLFVTSSNDDFASFTDQYLFSTAEFRPNTHNSRTLGAASIRWSNTYSVAGDFSGTLSGVDARFTGNVGVGITSPLAKLHVHDAASQVATILVSPMAADIEDSSKIFFSEGASGVAGMYWLYDGVGNDMELWGQYYGNKYGPHLTVNRTNGNMAIAGNITGNVNFSGNVALGGTYATGYKLSVGGKVICTELRVNQVADWPDYVFRKGYNLMPVGQLASYIEENGHLPNIPPASEIEKSGMDIGVMQKRMMEKIEELSLYIINQQKEIDELKARLENSSR